MQFEIALVLATLTTLVVTTPTLGSSLGRSPRASGCPTGDILCCESIESSSTGAVAQLIGFLGIVLDGVNIPVGLHCSTTDTCADPVCCQKNFNGIIAINCTTVTP